MASLFRSDFVQLAYYTAIHVFISVLTSIELVHYLATLFKLRVRSAICQKNANFRAYLKVEYKT